MENNTFLKRVKKGCIPTRDAYNGTSNPVDSNLSVFE